MDWTWNPWGIPELIAAAVPLTTGAFVYLVRPHALQNRLLALVLFGEAAMVSSNGLTRLMASPEDVFALRVLNQTVIWGMLVAYLAFLGTLGTPTSRPLASHRGKRVLLLLALGLMVSVSALPRVYITGVETIVIGGLEASWGPGNILLTVIAILVFLYALVVAFDAWRRAPRDTLRRRQSTAYLVAFGIRDLLWVTSIFMILAGVEATTRGRLLLAIVQVSAVVLFGPLLAYGILQVQLFDIDLKIKWGINRGTLVGVFLAVFFVVGVIAENWLTDRFGLALGGVAAGLLLFALNPLQRFADRISDAAMPHVRDDDEYRMVRKRDVYLAALEGALVDDVVSERERDMLVRLQDQLGLSATEARTLELRLTAPKEVA